MTRVSCTIAGVLSAAALVVFAACVGDDAGTSPAGVPDSSLVDGPTGTGMDAAPEAAADAAPDASAACGSPPKDCLGGECVAGMCQPATLVQDLNVLRPTLLALDVDALYFLDLGNGPACNIANTKGALLRVGLDGTGLKILAKDLLCPADLTLSGGFVYFIEQTSATTSAVRQITKAGANLKTIATATTVLSSFAVDGTDVYWTEMPAAGDGRVARVLGDGGVVGITTFDQPVVRELLLSPTDAIWLRGGTGGGAVAKASRTRVVDDGGVTPPFQSGETNVRAVALRGERLFWVAEGPSPSTTSGFVATFDLDAGVRTTLATSVDHPHRLAVDATHVYFTGTTPGILRVPLAGGAPATIATLASTHDIVVDDKALYVSLPDKGTVVRIAK